MKSFAGLPNKSSAITENLHRNRTGQQTRASTMKTLLTTCLCSLAFALISRSELPHPGQAPPATGGTSPGAQAPTNPAPGQQVPATNLPPGQQPPPPDQPGAVGQPPAVGQPGAPGAVTSPAAAGATSPAAAAATSPAPAVAAAPEKPGVLSSNWLIDQLRKGGPIMWPILIISIV